MNLINADVIDGLKTIPDHSVHCCITSPPYWGLRAYAGVQARKWDDGSECAFGLEPSLDLYIAHLVEVFSHLKRVLHPSGTFWLNIGDCYDHAGPQPSTGVHARNGVPLPETFKRRKTGRSKKNLAMVPARAALALQADGWLLRQDNIWVKGCSFLPSFSGSVMPESIQDRSIWAHEHLYHFALERYIGPEKMAMTEKDAIWLAAMIDAEGTVGIQTNTRAATGYTQFQIYVTFPNTNVDLVRRASHLMQTKSNEQEGTNFPLHVVRTNSRRAALILRAIRPHLIAKRLQCEVALACQQTVTPEKQFDAAYRAKLHDLCCQLNQGERPDMSWVKFEPEGVFRDQPYYYDIEGMKEPYADSTRKESQTPYTGEGIKDYEGNRVQNPSEVKRRILAGVAAGTGRNLRNVWVIPKQPLKEAHFAAFPEALVEPPIRLGSSDHGCCPTCFAPWERNLIKEELPDAVRQEFEAGRASAAAATGRGDGHPARRPNHRRKVLKDGWRPTCKCGHDEVVPCTVLDPFNGSGRCGVVAQRLGRNYIGIDASDAYCEIAKRMIDAAR